MLPAFRASGQTSPSGGSSEDVFDRYWNEVKDLIAERDNEKVPKEKERLELQIQIKRNAAAAQLDKSSAVRCPKTTPTVLPAKK